MSRARCLAKDATQGRAQRRPVDDSRGPRCSHYDWHYCATFLAGVRPFARGGRTKRWHVALARARRARHWGRRGEPSPGGAAAMGGRGAQAGAAVFLFGGGGGGGGSRIGVVMEMGWDEDEEGRG